jgi:hypothetical protein
MRAYSGAELERNQYFKPPLLFGRATYARKASKARLRSSTILNDHQEIGCSGDWRAVALAQPAPTEIRRGDQME